MVRLIPSAFRHAEHRMTPAPVGLDVVPTGVAAPNGDMARKDGIDLAELLISLQKVGPILLRLMVEQSWPAKQQLVREHEDDLLDPRVFPVVMLYMAEGDQEETWKSLLKYHWKLLHRCLQVGIDATFADARMRQEFEAGLLVMNNK